MSALVAVIYRDQRIATSRAVSAALPHLRPRGPDGTTLWAQGGAAFGHLALHATPEALLEQWPMRAPWGAWLLADARIDNRQEVLAQLGLRHSPEAVVTDGALIIAAHERWGQEAPARLVGDYAYLFWSPDARRVTLVRSALGLRFLYYRLLRDRLVVASSLRAVSALAPGGEPNRRWMASFLTQSWRPAEETALSGVRQVAPATCLTLELEQGSERATQFWTPTVNEDRNGVRHDEWLDGVRTCFEGAISAAFRTRGPVASSLSGGIDSSAINLVAHRMMHDDGRLPPRQVHSYSLRMAAFPDTDESTYRDAVAARLPHFCTAWLDVESAWCWGAVEAWHEQMSTPSLFPNAWMFRGLYAAARGVGSRVKVSGAGGDLITGSEDYALVDAWRSFPLAERVDEARYFRLRHLLGIWLHSEAPEPLRQRWVRLRRGPTHPLHTEAIRELTYEPPPRPAHGTPMQRIIQENLSYSHLLQPFHQRAEISAIHGLELRLPYYDRRLIDLTLQMPMRLRIRRGQTRVLFKQAIEDDLPALLFERTRKADFTRFAMESIPEADRRRGLRLAPDMWLARQGWIDRDAWQWWVAQRRWVALFRHAHVNQWVESWRSRPES